MKIAIIGAGPIGLYFAGLCEKYNIEYVIYEATDKIGGQLTNLYPKKEIVNIPGINSIKAEKYIDLLLKNIKIENIKLNSKITSVKDLKAFDYIIVSTGMGAYVPRKLEIAKENDPKVLYSLSDPEILRNKRVVIFGGGDSALDWAKHLSTMAEVSLVHRRDTFRGNANTIKECNIKVYLSYIPEEIINNKVIIKSVKDSSKIALDYDYILVSFGQVFIKQDFEESSNIKYIGDCICSTKTLATGIDSAEKIMYNILENLSKRKD